MSAVAILARLEARGWKEVEQWVADGEHEGVHLDFKKRSHATDCFSAEELAHISKAMSAFANVDGGLLVYGITAKKEPKGKRDRVQEAAPFAYVERVVGDLEGRIASLTDPAIPGVRVHAVPDPSRPGWGIVAIFVPASDGGPHQATQGTHSDRYFMRTASNSERAPHSVISAFFGRQPSPVLRLYLVRDPAGPLQLMVSNEGRGVADGVCARFKLTLRDHAGVDLASDVEALGAWGQYSTSGYRGGPDYRFDLRTETLIYPSDMVYVCKLAPVQTDMTVRVLARLDARNVQPVRMDADVQINGGWPVCVPIL